MKTSVVQNRYRPTIPSGENAVSTGNPHKHSTLLPATHISIYPVDRLAQEPADWVVMVHWNLQDEFTAHRLNFTLATSLLAAFDWRCLITREHREGTDCCPAPTGRLRHDRKGSKYG
jgi:C-methyltransferase C-terminal domain